MKIKNLIKFNFVCLFIFLILIVPVLSQTNNPIIESLNANIDLTEKAFVSINYTLKNMNNVQESTNITIKPLYTTLNMVFNPWEVKSLNLEYELPISKEGNIGVLSFDPQLLFNNYISGNPIKYYNILVKLPFNVNKILTTTKEEYSVEEDEDGRIIYKLLYKNIYSSRLIITWSDLPIDITLNKTTIINNDIITVVLNIINNKDMEVNNIKLLDYFFPADFEILEKENKNKEFEMQTGLQSDIMILWKKEINLAPLESKDVTYSIKLRNKEAIVSLKPTKAYYNDTLIATSNEVKIYPEFCGNKICGSNENYKSCPIDCPKEKLNYSIILIILSITITLILVYYMYKKKFHKY